MFLESGDRAGSIVAPSERCQRKASLPSMTAGADSIARRDHTCVVADDLTALVHAARGGDVPEACETAGWAGKTISTTEYLSSSSSCPAWTDVAVAVEGERDDRKSKGAETHP